MVEVVVVDFVDVEHVAVLLVRHVFGVEAVGFEELFVGEVEGLADGGEDRPIFFQKFFLQKKNRNFLVHPRQIQQEIS